jgi:hypothetical protein
VIIHPVIMSRPKVTHPIEGCSRKLALAGLITAVVYCWGQPIVLAVCMALGICILAVSIMGRQYRKATTVLLVAARYRLGRLDTGYVSGF